ncbi:MAG: ATP-binding protein [Lachnospiraceae bacterium]|nr:ATP-binding protein [Lachnospiraceae bacterium]
MERVFYQELCEWEKQGTPEPMLVIGARQVGKTYIIKKFCEKNYSDYIYLNLEKQPEYIEAFEGGLTPEGILREIEIISGQRVKEDTAVFIDEIQQSERAVTALKYFCESEKKYRIIGAGSLLGVKLNRFEGSFPVGKITFRQMYPLSFREFLSACGEELLEEVISESVSSMQPLSSAIHDKALKLYHDYLYVGGMPRSVSDYLEQDKNVMHTDANILSALMDEYLADMTKYTISPAEGVKIQETYRSVPRQLAHDNPKFKYKEVRTYATKRDFMLPVDWLVSSRMVLKVKKCTFAQSPLSVYEDTDSFKLYLSDVGMLSRQSGMLYKNLRSSEDNLFKGILAENFVVQQMASHMDNMYYFKPDQSMEIDLLLDTEDGVIPLEIKAGRHRRSTSLRNYREKYDPSYAYRLSENNFGEIDGLKSIPIYAAGWIR